MLFNSYEFLLGFLPTVIFAFFVSAYINTGLALALLGMASLFFYGWWNPAFLWLLGTSIAINYSAGWLLSRNSGKRGAKTVLIIAISANLGLLTYYKYTNFLLGTANHLLDTHLPALDIVLPLGISFFTFTQIAFLVDAYKGIAREVDFSRYVLFVTYFPHLIAGPVLHHKQMMPQFLKPEVFRPSAENFAIGLSTFAIGLAKKVMLADTFALNASPVFDAAKDGDVPSMAVAWGAALAYTLQLYFDFSGYSDMAVGLSRIFGIRLPINFYSPYKAPNIIEFWRRWHMTLSQFLRDYLYIPLGGNRDGRKRRYVNLMITMLLGGLWHGAAWTFVAWGALHGAYLVINNAFRFAWNSTGLPAWSSWWGMRALGVLLTFIVVVVAWVYFRADSIATANLIIGSMAGASESVGHPGSRQIAELVLGLCIIFFLPNSQQMFAGGDAPEFAVRSCTGYSLRTAVILGALMAGSLLFLGRHSEFLYFQF